ncbi:MAG: hypothetical protein EOP46_12525 [Sphingobacteriaceae bacterium]|nr:MAG: hypothetical protein EOP46_12525 [Sphingobacteriaceae bacterium]
MDIPAIYIDNIEDYRLCDVVSVELDKQPAQAIGNSPWAQGEENVSASFAIACGDSHIFLKYYVTEGSTQALHNRFNDPVYNDSCVELFIAFNGDEKYYNLEFNCTGNSLVQYGSGKDDRMFVPAALLKEIKHQTSLKSINGAINWTLTLCIPKTVFCYHKQLNLLQGTAKINVYKCGDGLPRPHYLCWANVESAEPNFHLSRFFKEVKFSQQQLISA